MAKHHFASMLSSDEQRTRDGAQEEEESVRAVALQLTEAGIESEMPFPVGVSPPKFGMSNYAVRSTHLAAYIEMMQWETNACCVLSGRLHMWKDLTPYTPQATMGEAATCRVEPGVVVTVSKRTTSN
jgi:hypothetical protein